MKTSENTDTVSIGALIEDLKNTDPKARLHAIKNLHVISNGLGKERTRSELLPFINDLIDDEEDDNLVELSKILGSFLELVGGKAYVLKLIKILETLLSFDEGLIQSEVEYNYI
jgi:serine/threonine-protein phosphatase 2A regulatory subunit A